MKRIDGSPPLHRTVVMFDFDSIAISLLMRSLQPTQQSISNYDV